MKTHETKPVVDSNQYAKLVAAYETIVKHLMSGSEDANFRSNFTDTPERCVRALLASNKTDDQLYAEINHIISRVFPIRDRETSGMVTQGPVTVNSMCPHHLAPVRYEAFISYIPAGGLVLGLSKLARIAKILGQRAVLQEQLAADIADVLYAPPSPDTNEDGMRWPALRTTGSAVTLVGTHTCMACRGIESDARTTTTELRGAYWEPGIELKFQTSIGITRNARPF